MTVFASSFSFVGKRVWVAGHRGLLGSALIRRLAHEECLLVTADRAALDLRRQADVESFVESQRPQALIIAAGTVGGILANSRRPADFLNDNLLIQANLIRAAHQYGIEKILVVGSSCIYPTTAPRPIAESSLMDGPLEPTNEWYAVAKIASIKLAQAYRAQHGCDFISAIPTNLYGPGDNFAPQSSHVLAGLVRRACEAAERGDAEMTVWGSGLPRREFLHVDDCAEALVFLMKSYSDREPINVGTGQEITIHALAHMVARCAGFAGRLVFDTSKPDGVADKMIDSSRLLALGWRPTIEFESGVRAMIDWYRLHGDPGTRP